MSLRLSMISILTLMAILGVCSVIMYMQSDRDWACLATDMLQERAKRETLTPGQVRELQRVHAMCGVGLGGNLIHVR